MKDGLLKTVDPNVIKEIYYKRALAKGSLRYTPLTISSSRPVSAQRELLGAFTLTRCFSQ